MPYIKASDKTKFYKLLGRIATTDDMTEGELNFLITQLCTRYLHQHGKRYSTINSIIGALECSKQEFYRRIATPYEDIKKEENGDAY